MRNNIDLFLFGCSRTQPTSRVPYLQGVRCRRNRGCRTDHGSEGSDPTSARGENKAVHGSIVWRAPPWCEQQHDVLPHTSSVVLRMFYKRPALVCDMDTRFFLLITSINYVLLLLQYTVLHYERVTRRFLPEKAPFNGMTSSTLSTCQYKRDLRPLRGVARVEHRRTRSQGGLR